MPPRKGFTLVEFMVSVAVLAILSATAIPNFNYFIVKTRVDNEITELYRLLLITRNIAINSGVPITLCPVNNNNECTVNWNNKLIVFLDQNSNGKFEPSDGDSIIKEKAAINTNDRLLYGKGRSKISYEPTGRLEGWGMNGTFRYCPKANNQLAKGVRVAVSGRVYKTSDINNDGKDEVRTGAKLSCD